MISKERKWFELRPARKLKVHPYIDSWGVYHGIYDAGLFKFRYSSKFAEFIGKTMPHGIGEDRKVRIHVYQIDMDRHIITATCTAYVHSEILWVSDTRPEWTEKLDN